jgi:minor extracellular serine protease Vpr
MTLGSARRTLCRIIIALLSVFPSASGRSNAAAVAGKVTFAKTSPYTETARDGREAYIVVFRDAPLARTVSREAWATRIQALRSLQGEFERDMHSRIPRFRAGARYVHVLNGMAVLVPKGALDALRSDPRVRDVYPVRKYELYLDASNTVMGAPTFWSALGGDDNAGKGVKIADLGTGVDFSNPMFSDPSLPMPDGFPLENDGNSFANSKVIVAKYFQGIVDATDPGLSLAFRTAQDLDGHGSHTASVAAGAKVTLSGSGRRPVTLEGVAPRAYIGDYKVFSPGAYSDNIIEAIEAAVTDGMNVLNMSFGIAHSDGTEPFLYSTTADNEVIQNAIAAGVVITVSAGNGGQDANGNPNANADSIGAPANVPEVIAVGASTNAHDGVTSANLAEVSMKSGKTAPPANLTNLIGSIGIGGPAIPDPPLSALFNDWDLLDDAGDGTACNALSSATALTGQIVLIQRGTCTFTQKIQNALTAGATGVAFYNAANGPDGGDRLIVFDASSSLIPSVFLRRSDGLNLKAYLDASVGNAPAAQGTLGTAPEGTPSAVFSTTSHELAGFSSIGPTIDLQIKPDLVTVGTGSYAATQDDDPLGYGYDPSGFAFSQGTSFSAPRAAGSAALVKQKHPDWTPAEIKAALMETASRPTDASDPARIGNLSVLQRGSGEIDLAAASAVGSIVLPASYSYRRGAFNAIPAANALDRVFTLENRTGSIVTYTMTAAASAAHSDPAVTPSITPGALTLSPGASGTFALSLALGSALIHGQHDSEGAILVTDGGASIPAALSVPYWIRVVYPAGHGPVVNSTSATFSSTLDQLDLLLEAHDDDADLASLSISFYDASGRFSGSVANTFADLGVDTSASDLSLDLQIPTFTTFFGCRNCVSVSVSVTDAAGNVSSALFSRFGTGVGPEAVPATSGAAYQRSIPLVAHIQGAQFLFQSDVRLFNPDRARRLTLDAYFVPQGQAGANAFHVAHQLLPRQSFALDDLIANDFNLPSGIGSLVVVSSDGHPFLASSRAYDTNAAGGTFGTFAGSITPQTGVASGDGTVSANGFPTETGFHTNVGATEVTGTATSVRFEGFDESGASVGSFTRTVPAYSNLQFNPSADAVRAFAAPAARVSFTVLSGGKILPYAAAVDEGSGDTLLSLATAAPESSSDVLVTGAGRVHGALGTLFTSDLAITNGSSGPRTVDVSLIASGIAPPTSPSPIPLAAGQTIVLRDVLQSAFGFATDAVAGIRIHPETPASLVASVRTATPNNAGAGSYGFFVNGVKLSDGLAAGGKAISIHLENDARFRTNFGFTEVSGAPMTVRATFFEENGTLLGTRAYSVAGGSFFQTSASDVLGAVALGNGYIEFTIDAGTGVMLPFATVVDNATGDAIYIPGEKEP